MIDIKKALLVLGIPFLVTFWGSSLPSYGEEHKYHMDTNISLAIADLNRDGYPDVVVRSENGYLYALSGDDGHVLWKFKFK